MPTRKARRVGKEGKGFFLGLPSRLCALYWGENGRAHVGKTIVVGGEDPKVPAVMGWDSARSMDEALEMAASHVGHKPSITLMHNAPINMVDVLGTPESV
ncbi:MAG: hypothetical protein ACLQOO_15465 [Terriglobia bacterium]